MEKSVNEASTITSTGIKISVVDNMELKRKRQSRFGTANAEEKVANKDAEKIKQRLERFGHVEGCKYAEKQKIEQRLN
ncbi:hypothetical protein HZS_2001, partial [Henneguya salminicola]